MSSSHSPSAVVALGSNLGNSRGILQQAMERLEQLSARPLVRSSLWQTEPVDCPPGSPPFVNAVVQMELHPDETPVSLMHKLHALEKEFGRQPKTVLNQPRPLDLDLIVFDDILTSTTQLTLPHPRAHLRAFVLAPLVEIRPDLTLPGQTRTVQELLEDLGDGPTVQRLP